MIESTFQIGNEFPLVVAHSGIIKIGRDPRSHLVIDDEDVSRMHAVIEIHGEDATLIDLGNEPGSKVNGARINKCKIRPGSRLTFGSTDVLFLGEAKPEDIQKFREKVREMEADREKSKLVEQLRESTGCSEDQAREMLDKLNENADNVRWVYCDGKVDRIRLIGQKVELPDGSRHLPSDLGGFEELKQFETEWDALEYGVKFEQEQLERAEARVENLKERLRRAPSTHGWREPS